MTNGILFPDQIVRKEGQRIRQVAAQVLADGRSCAVLLYGSGGVGKTSLVRQLAQTATADEGTIWLEPIDVDDPRYWLLSNLEQEIAGRLDPGNRYFGPYFGYLSRLPAFLRPHIDHETVVSHLGRIKEEFIRCYKRFVEENRKIVVIALDTVEAVRGMYLLLTLTQWMKALPRTLFILSGRPPDRGDAQDPIRRELDDPYRGLPVTVVELTEFAENEAFEYLNASAVAAALSEEEKRKLVLLTRGHPLWLAFTLHYLSEVGIPEEAGTPLTIIERDLPYAGPVTPAGQIRQEAYKRRLVAPYRATDFWHEAIKRLAVVRQSIDQTIWQRLMQDFDRPRGVTSWDDAWEELKRKPWIRPRANRRQVTLHDAVAEELAVRIIPLHDQSGQWRRRLWERAVAIYGELTEGLGADLTRRMEEVQRAEEAGPLTTERERLFIQAMGELDAEKRELDQMKAAHLHYQLLSEPNEGCRQFLTLFEDAAMRHDVLFQHLIATEMQLFLPDRPPREMFGEVIGGAIEEFHRWLSTENPMTYLEVGLSMADYLIRNEQPQAAMRLLSKLPADRADASHRYRLSIQRGNACLRIAGRVRDAETHFDQACTEATRLRAADRTKAVAEAFKELGFYYRNVGLWEKADQSYRKALDAISETLTSRSSADDREEMASIQTNWAYVKGLNGSYGEALHLVESAIAVRQRLGREHVEGISWSVCGEVFRYAGRFERAWESYQRAEQIFDRLRSLSWLGLIYQEQAICLFQAADAGIELVPDPSEEAKRLITLAVDICRDWFVRGYPPALNRAGRIFGREDPKAALGRFEEAIMQSRELSDGRSLLANLIEFVELSYRLWLDDRRVETYRSQITRRVEEIDQAILEYPFQDLEGRWHLLQGHLDVHAALESGGEPRLQQALRHYETGFALIAEGSVGTHGAVALANDFQQFGELFGQLQPETRAEWEKRLRSAWRGSTSLLARLDYLLAVTQ
jgi:tetratricopeptide (TPR) repeat protein